MRDKDKTFVRNQQCISVVGQAGIGKTTLSKKIYGFGEHPQSLQTIYHLVISQFIQNGCLFVKRKTNKNIKEGVKKVSMKMLKKKLKLFHIWQEFRGMVYFSKVFPSKVFQKFGSLIPHSNNDLTAIDLIKEKQLVGKLKKIDIKSKKEISIHSNKVSSLFRMVILDCYVTAQIIYEEGSVSSQIVSQTIINLMKFAFNGFKDSDTDIILASFYFVNCLSIRDFEETDWNKSHKSKQILLATSWLLNAHNWHLAKCLSFITELHEDLNEKYATKQEILLEFINDQLKDNPHDQFYVECLQHLEDSSYFPPGYGAVCQMPDVTKICCWPGICLKLELHNTDNDGMVYDRAKDPPGQRSVYIPPGDSYQESYRLSTFLRFPDQIPVNPRQLASAGFLYTGYKDRVKCFSCGLCVEDWAIGDDVTSTRWHRSDCDHIRGTECGNVTIGGGGIARFLIPRGQSTPIGGLPRHPSPPVAMETWPPSAARASTNQSAVNSRAPASSHRPHMTARAPNQTSSINTVEFATIASAYHENFVKNLDLRKESERLRTYEHFPTSSPTVTTHDLARSGFFYLGNLDRVQCFSCGGVLRNWNYGDSVQSEHRRHFPTCGMVQGSETRNIPLTSDERAANTPQQPIFTEPPDPPQSEQQDLRAMFPCEYPVSPHMRNEDSRFQTFDERWSANNVQATPQQISKAGFFYLGERDRVKCWYCNGGLQNWDPQDEPWTEHAKWFPTCEFLLQRKGPDFVHRMVSMFPNLPRPLLRGPFDVPPTQRGTRIQFGSNSARAPTPPPEIIDPQAELRREEERVDHAMTSEIVRAALDLGFSTRLVRKVVRRRIRRTAMYTSVADLIDDVTIEERENGSDDEEEMTSSSAVASTSQAMEAETSEETSPSMLQRIHELQDERKCKLCHTMEADNVLVPCGHLCICTSCTSKTSKCPLCRRKFDKAIRTYIT